MALMPVCSGSCTGWRPVMPGAWISRRRSLSCGIGALAVDRDTERVHHAAEQRVADRDREDAAGRADELAFLDLVGLAEHHRADVVLFEVQRETERAALELEQLVDRGVGQPRDARDAVADLQHATDLLGLDRRVEALDVLAQDRRDVGRVDGEFGQLFPALKGRSGHGSLSNAFSS